MILVADDDEDDRMLIEDALFECGLEGDVRFVEDGEQVLDYLRQCHLTTRDEAMPVPNLVLLDLNMPRKDGREVLREIKKSEVLRSIPVVVLTTSRAQEDILKTYELGVNSFISKPVTFDGLVDVMRAMKNYWFETVLLPGA